MSIELVQGDERIPLLGTITDDDTGDAENLTDCTVFFQMRKKDDNRYTVNAEAEILSASAGTVRYITAANDLNTPGDYLAQFEVHYPDDTIQTTAEWIEITVRRQ